MDISDVTWMIYRPEPLKDVIRGTLLNALAFTSGNQHEAAKLLGITGRVMSYIMSAHGIPTASMCRGLSHTVTRACQDCGKPVVYKRATTVKVPRCLECRRPFTIQNLAKGRLTRIGPRMTSRG